MMLMQLARPARMSLAARSLHTARSATLAPAASPVQPQTDVQFPKSAKYMERMAAASAAAAAAAAAPAVAPAAKKRAATVPRHFLLRTSARPLPQARPPVRLEDGKVVPWKVSRLTSGLLPVSVIKPQAHENSKEVLHIQNVTGNSFVRELQLFVGPLYHVRTNSVGSVVQVHSCPKSRVNTAFTDKVKRWMVTIGI